MAISKAEKLAKIHEEAMQEFDKIQTALRDERLQCLQDRRFYSIAGAQWEGPLGQQFENKPRLEVNKIHLSLIRIFNEYRNNRISVNFISKEGDETDALADTCAKLFRADEQDSVAEEAYDNAFEEAVGGGFGAFRLRTEYEDESNEDNERQRIRIEPIFDADSSVFFDLNAKRQDKADAVACYVLSSMTYDAYREAWDDEPSSIHKNIYQRMFDWLTPDVVYIAEYYRLENAKDVIYYFQGIGGDERKIKESELQDDENLRQELEATGYFIARSKKIKIKKVRKYILNGSRVLEDCGYIAGNCIPIIPVYGKRWFIDNVERCMGHVRLAKDPQRLKNMQLSKLAEIAALSSVEKPIFTPEQIGGHQIAWSEDNIKNYPYLLVNQLTDVNGNIAAIGPQAYTRSPQIPPATAALLTLTETDLQDVLGNQQAAEKLQGNISAQAVELVQNKLDMQAFIYISNLAKAIKRCGEVWLSMAAEVFIEEKRKLKGIGNQGQVEKIELMTPTLNEKGELVYENDLSEARLDVAIEVGPSSASRRQSTVRMLTNMLGIMQQDQETANVISSMIMMNMDGEGVSDVRKYFRNRLLRMGVIKPTQEEAQQLMQEQQAQQPDAQSQFLLASAQEAQAKAAKAKADTLHAVAKAKEAEASTVEKLASIDINKRKQVLDEAERVLNSNITATAGPMTGE